MSMYIQFVCLHFSHLCSILLLNVRGTTQILLFFRFTTKHFKLKCYRKKPKIFPVVLSAVKPNLFMLN